MNLFACGVAFVDRSGAIVAADRSFLAHLGLPEDDPSSALRALAGEHAEIALLLAGDGPPIVSVPWTGRSTLEVERVSAEGGALLLLREPECEERQEHAIRSQLLGVLAAGVAHDIKNPLNAMSLQVALLSEKLASSPGVIEAERHLGTVREQILRVDEVVRRLIAIVDPPQLDVADLGALVSDVAAMLGHAARSRGISVTVTAPRLATVVRCEPARVGRLVVGLMARALAETPDGGLLSVRVQVDGGRALLLVDHTAGDANAGLGYYSLVAEGAARRLGGSLAQERDGEAERLALILPSAAGAGGAGP